MNIVSWIEQFQHIPQFGTLEQTCAQFWKARRKSPHASTVYISNVWYNHGHDIMRIFDVLPDFPFTTSETKPDYW